MPMTGKERAARFRERSAKYKASYVKSNARLKGTNAYKAHRKVDYQIRLGKISKASDLLCADCGQPAQCYDHRDYLKPLEIEPVCKKCNYLRGPAENF